MGDPRGLGAFPRAEGEGFDSRGLWFPGSMGAPGSRDVRLPQGRSSFGKIQWIFKPEEGGVAVLGWLEELLFVHQLPLSLQDADRDLLRRFLMTSVLRVQFRSDRGWQLITSDLISSRSTWVLILSLTFFGRLRVRFGHRCSCELRRACQPRRLLQRLRAENAV